MVKAIVNRVQVSQSPEQDFGKFGGWKDLPPDLQSLVLTKLSPFDLARASVASRDLARLSAQAPQWSRLLSEAAAVPVLARPQQILASRVNAAIGGPGARTTLQAMLRVNHPPALHTLLCSENIWQAQLLDWQDQEESSGNARAAECVLRIQQARDSGAQTLDLTCLPLSSLPPCISRLTSLQNLYLDLCKRLQALPESIGRLPALKRLDLLGCESLQVLPASIGQLSALRVLRLLFCKSLKTLPPSIGQLSALEELFLSGSGLQAFPESIGQLSALRMLDLMWCHSLQALPASIGQLAALVMLNLDHCSGLQVLPESIRRGWPQSSARLLAKDRASVSEH